VIVIVIGGSEARTGEVPAACLNLGNLFEALCRLVLVRK
jgi:hypothetical protein